MKGPFPTQLVSRETLLLDITVLGKTTKVIFDIVDMGPEKDMILGQPWHEDYNPDIDWKDGGHLRPRTYREYPTNDRKSGARKEQSAGQAPSTAPPQETREILVYSIDIGGKIEEVGLIGTVALVEIAAVMKDKYAYYNNIKKGDKKEVPVEYQGYPVFTAKYL